VYFCKFNQLKLNIMQNTYAIGIDVGGTNTDLGLVRDDSKIVSRRSLPTGNYALIEPYVQDIIDQIKEMLSEGDPEAGVTSIRMDELTGIGMGAPNGNFYTGCVEWAPNLPIRGPLDFQKEFGKHTSIPFVLSNDANAAAYGEYVYGGAKGMEHFIMITLGTGVGSGIVVDGRLVHGSTGTAGAIVRTWEARSVFSKTSFSRFMARPYFVRLRKRCR
jgi:glucokinase